MPVVAGFDLLGELGVQQAVLKPQLSVLLHHLFNVCLVEVRARVVLQDLIFELVAGEMEFGTHFSQLQGSSHNCVVFDGRSLNLIGAALGVEQGHRGTLSQQFTTTALEMRFYN